MGADRFRRAFEACIEAQLDNSHKKNGWATSFLRDDLPIKSYGDKFGWLIRAAPSQLKCAYAFDAYKGFGKLPTSTRPASQLLRRRATTVRRACVRWKHTPMAGVWAQHQSPELNCCFAEREDALWAQREYVALNHSSKCERGNGLNQMQLAWRANDIFGVYYVLDHDARHARQLLRYTTRARALRAREASAAETPAAAGGALHTPAHGDRAGAPLSFCRLPFDPTYAMHLP